MSPGFWSGGYEEYEKAIRAEYDQLLSLLHVRLKSVTCNLERLSIEAEIVKIQAELRSKLNSAKEALY